MVSSGGRELLVGPRYFTVEEQEAMLAGLLAAKCARFMMGTCYRAEPDEAAWCAVCKVLDGLGYEPHRVSEGGLEAWRLRGT